jgi:hypothetical protein
MHSALFQHQFFARNLDLKKVSWGSIFGLPDGSQILTFRPRTAHCTADTWSSHCQARPTLLDGHIREKVDFVENTIFEFSKRCASHMAF